MESALSFEEIKEIKQLDILSGLLVVLFAFFLLLFYSSPLIETVQGAMLPLSQMSFHNNP